MAPQERFYSTTSAYYRALAVKHAMKLKLIILVKRGQRLTHDCKEELAEYLTACEELSYARIRKKIDETRQLPFEQLMKYCLPFVYFPLYWYQERTLIASAKARIEHVRKNMGPVLEEIKVCARLASVEELTESITRLEMALYSPTPSNAKNDYETIMYACFDANATVSAGDYGIADCEIGAFGHRFFVSQDLECTVPADMILAAALESAEKEEKQRKRRKMEEEQKKQDELLEPEGLPSDIVIFH